MDAVEQLFKKLIKEIHKVQVQATSVLIVNQQQKTINEIKSTGKKEIQQASDAITQGSENLKSVIQGQFGQKLTQVLVEQTNTLNNLK